MTQKLTHNFFLNYKTEICMLYVNPLVGVWLIMSFYFPNFLSWKFKKSKNIFEGSTCINHCSVHAYIHNNIYVNLSLARVLRNVGTCNAIHTEGACRLIRSWIHLEESGCSNYKKAEKKIRKLLWKFASQITQVKNNLQGLVTSTHVNDWWSQKGAWGSHSYLQNTCLVF